jgi:DMSO/TMAO reductase YedYZ heme-binding membrane subunit
VTALWYTTRASGAVSLLLLTMSMLLGVAAIGRVRSRGWPRFATDGLHRHLALLAVVFLAVHIISAVLDSFAPIGIADAFVPFVGQYRPVWLGLGAVAFDLLLAVALTSALRLWLGHRAWRAVHWLAYLCWPVAVLHGLGTGSDIHQAWMAAVYVGCTAAVLVAVLARAAIGWPERSTWRAFLVGVAVAFVVGVTQWLPTGPLGAGWARRAGTPVRLLPASDRAASQT